MTTIVNLSSEQIADTAVDALIAEAVLTPKPGLVDASGRHSHPDMSLAMLTDSALSLREPLRQCADAARTMPLGPDLRMRIGVIGRDGERRMLDATGGVNTHRGALWALGLLSAGVAGSENLADAVAFAARLARLADPARGRRASHGERARVRYGARGAEGEAQDGFPHVVGHGLPTLRASRMRGESADAAALNALLAIMSVLDDTCVLHRGGARGLAFAQRSAADVLRSGGCGRPAGRRRLEVFCRQAARLGLSTGGSADLLAATLFLDAVLPQGS
ncbi:triphosphoribosyl-dephospho-CoA synthase [Mycobacterium sp. 3519A]|uniref:triphosphoribosyl-dephospho-CoA synthase n=1 Tax=Mycobacterium sp. 3519A TaxID=2057184 RepID=UPI000C7C86E2|nr:triphosphoribosyl-dephospho-CoA synthase [Mycobacterium sp. 3519A]